MSVDLRDFDDDYDNAEVYHNDFTPLPDGTYQVCVDEVCLKETKREFKPMLAWKLKVMSGPYQDRVLFKNSVVNNKDSLPYIKTDLSVCGLQLDRLSDLENHLKDLLDIQLEVKVVNKKTNAGDDVQNVYFQRQIETSSSVEEGDIPF